MKTLISSSEKETLSIGFEIGKKCKGSEIFSLSGNLGSGKTVISKGIARGLGLKKNISSPTFVILNKYKINNKTPIKNLVHSDVYRIKNKKDLESIGFFEFIKNKDQVMIIEWGNKIKRYLPANTTYIKFFNLKNGNKKITIF